MLNIYGNGRTPAVLAASIAMSAAVAECGTFDARTREAIALAVGSQNGCWYRQSAHTLGAMRAGWSEEDTVAIRSAQLDFYARLDVLLAVAREIVANVGEVFNEDYEQARWAPQAITKRFRRGR